jgi:hypothetical protein
LTLFVAQRYAFLSLWPARLQTEWAALVRVGFASAVG